MEQDALNQLYRRWQRELYLYLFSLCQNKAQAEDLLQETFLKAMLSLPEGHGNARAWLYRVARNLYFDQRKRDSRLVSRENWENERPEGDPAGEDPAESLLRNEKLRALYTALGQLEERKREVLQLQYFSGLSQREIAAVMQLKPDYVRVLAMRARQEVRKWMEEKGYDLS